MGNRFLTIPAIALPNFNLRGTEALDGAVSDGVSVWRACATLFAPAWR